VDQEAFQQFLTSKFQVELRQARQRATHHQRFAKWSEWGLIIFSSITTVLLAISSFLRGLPITPLTAVCSAFVTTIAATMKSLRTQEKWSFYQKLSNDLENEYYLYKAQEGIYHKFTDKEAQFVKRVISLIDDANKKMPQRTLTDAPLANWEI
jgi:hypothetical protein